MCGIVGYVGNNNVCKKLINGLKKLEYRGYDSAGVAMLDKNNEIKIIREAGKVMALEQKIESINDEYERLGIAHTRWATHGTPTEKNAHPHKVGSVILVHNGIIENYVELKNELISKGMKFNSTQIQK